MYEKYNRGNVVFLDSTVAFRRYTSRNLLQRIRLNLDYQLENQILDYQRCICQHFDINQSNISLTDRFLRYNRSKQI